MTLNHGPGEHTPYDYVRQSDEGAETEPALKRLTLKKRPVSAMRSLQPRIKRRRTWRIVCILLIFLLPFILVRVGDQGTTLVDLRQGLPISPYFLGANVFPVFHTNSMDHVNGFMDYSSQITAGLRNAHIQFFVFLVAHGARSTFSRMTNSTPLVCSSRSQGLKI